MRADDKVTTPSRYITSLPADRKAEIRRLHELIRKTVPQLKPFILSGMLGYGPYHYRYASGREGDSAIIGLASQKQYMAIYVCAADERGHLAERYRDRLPKANIGKGCVRFKRVDDLDSAVLRFLLKEAARLGGMGAA